MKKSILITPLNCSCLGDMNPITFMEASEYEACATRALYCKNPDLSWFKMKTVGGAAAYVEPTFFGLLPGDVIEIEFSALAVSGSTALICRVYNVSNAYVSTLLTIETISKTLTPHYQNYRFKYVIPLTYTGIGIALNPRPLNEVESEVIIKDMVITIDSKNSLFDPSVDVVAYKTKTDYMQWIDHVCGSPLVPAWANNRTVFDAGGILFPDDYTLRFSGVDTTNFKGIGAMFGGYTYKTAMAIYCEYVTSGANVITGYFRRVNEAGSATLLGNYSFPAAASVRKAIYYTTTDATACRKLYMDLGKTDSNNFSMKNLRFAVTRHDDSPKIQPNKLQELYTNLRTLVG